MHPDLLLRRVLRRLGYRCSLADYLGTAQCWIVEDANGRAVRASGFVLRIMVEKRRMVKR